MDELEDFQSKYNTLLQQYNQYRSKIIAERENELREFQKFRANLDKTYKQMQKKYETKLQEERTANDKKLRKAEAIWKQKEEQANSVILHKSRFIEQLKKKLADQEAEKHQIIQDHTRMLYDLCEDMENSEQNLGPHKNSYQDLVRLYQFVLEENNNLKKQIFKVQIKSKELQPEQPKPQNRPIIPIKKQQKKKKKLTSNESDNSRLNYESTKTKAGQGSVKKEVGKKI